MRLRLAGAGLAGAVFALAVAAVTLWIGGGNDMGAIEARIAQVERQVADLAARMPTDTASSAAVDDLASRLAKLEARAKEAAQAGAAPASEPVLADRITALESGLKALGERLDDVAQRGESASAANAAAVNDLTRKLARADASAAQPSETSIADANAALIAALAGRVDALEAAARALAAQEERAAENSSDRVLRTAILASALASLVERGRPFAPELKAAQAQAADPRMLAPLAGFAAAGVPNPGILARELSELEPALLRAAGAGRPEGGLLEKLEANAERLVRIHPIEEAAGDDPAAVISRVELKAVRGDLPGALAELGNLPANVRAPAQGWIDKAQAREAALAASRAFAADALDALGKR